MGSGWYGRLSLSMLSISLCCLKNLADLGLMRRLVSSG